MYNPDFIDLTQRFLFSTEEEMTEAKIPKKQQERILRLRRLVQGHFLFPEQGLEILFALRLGHRAIHVLQTGRGDRGSCDHPHADLRLR